MRAPLAVLAALVASAAAATAATTPRRQPLTLKVLAQRRPAELSTCQQSHWEEHKEDCDYERKIRRRTCVVCAREAEYKGPPFPVCECGTRVYCGEECQAQDWTAEHSLLCASRPGASAEPFDSDALAAFLEGDLDDVDDI